MAKGGADVERPWEETRDDASSSNGANHLCENDQEAPGPPNGSDQAESERDLEEASAAYGEAEETTHCRIE